MTHTCADHIACADVLSLSMYSCMIMVFTVGVFECVASGDMCLVNISVHLMTQQTVTRNGTTHCMFHESLLTSSMGLHCKLVDLFFTLCSRKERRVQYVPHLKLQEIHG